MGMTANYVRCSEKELEKIVSGDTDRIDAILDERLYGRERIMVGGEENATPIDNLCRKYASHGWFYTEEKAKELGMSEEDLANETKRRGLHIWFNLDKCYNELHALLTGDEFPLDLPKTNRLLSLCLIAEDHVRGTEDYGYGPARYVRPSTVKDIALTMEDMTYSQLVEENSWDSDQWGTDDDDMEQMFEHFKSFYKQAAESGEAVLLIFL